MISADPDACSFGSVFREPSSAMHELLEAIGKAKTWDDLLPILESLGGEVDRLAGKKGITAVEMQRIAVYLTGIRLLLRELERYGGRFEQMTVRTMAMRYLELEGRIKEVRNDLEPFAERKAS